MLTDKSKHEQHILLPVLKKYLRNHTHSHLLGSIHFHEGIIMDQISRQVILVGGLSARTSLYRSCYVLLHGLLPMSFVHNKTVFYSNPLCATRKLYCS